MLNSLTWLLGGNPGTNPASNFLGTTDNQPLHLRVNNRRAVRYQYAEDTSNSDSNLHYRSINVLGGSELNEIAAGVVGATIAGGGRDHFNATDLPNRALEHFATIGGGSDNTASGHSSTVAGGARNIAGGHQSTVGGGDGNTSSERYATVGGGVVNTASGDSATVGGGYGNIASGVRATIPGGESNQATGHSSFAAGYGARANHAGTFVWSDLTDFFGFTSTGTNQFLIRAGGGVGINTNAPQTSLHVRAMPFNAGLLLLEGVDHAYIQFFPRGLAEGRKAYIGFPGAGSHDLNIANEDGGAVRVVGTFVNNSDARYKMNVASLDNALESILNLRGVSYDWRQDMPGQRFTEQRQIGFIAQEVEKVLPELVYTDEKGYKSVAYVNVVPVVVEAIKSLKKDNDDKQKQIDALKAKNDALEARLNALEAALSARNAPGK